jgi:hypothetical protein
MVLPSISREWSLHARKPKPFVRVVAGLALLFATAFGRADEANQAPDDQKDLARLAAVWQSNLTEVKSAHVRYRSLSRPTSKSVTRDEVLKLLETTDFVTRPDDARLLSNALGLEIPPGHAAWSNGELYVAGTNVRVNSDYKGRRHSEMVLMDTNRIVANPSNKQIEIYARKSLKRYVKSLDDLRVIPRLEKQTATIEKRSADGLVLNVGKKQFVVEVGTGFVQSVRMGPAGPAQSSQEIVQKGRVTYPGGIVFPAAIITCRYVGNEVKSIRIDVIETATFNEPIKDKVFAVNAPAGSKVFDFRRKREDPGFFTAIGKPVEDIITELDPK